MNESLTKCKMENIIIFLGKIVKQINYFLNNEYPVDGHLIHEEKIK
jgi:hypothetical protein